MYVKFRYNSYKHSNENQAKVDGLMIENLWEVVRSC